MRIGRFVAISITACAVALSATPPPSRAQPTPSANAVATSSAGPAASESATPPPAEPVEPAPEPSPKPEEKPKVKSLVATAGHIRALLKDTLDIGIEPATLFDIDIADPDTVDVEARRLTAVIQRAKREAQKPEVVPPPPTSASTQTPPPPAPSVSASAMPVAPPPEPEISEYDKLREADEALWRARIELDEARLDFYRLSPEMRKTHLDNHRKRQDADRESKSEKELAEADREAKQAEQERQAALDAAKRARSEAERAVHEEHARLLDVRKHQAEYQKELTTLNEAIQKRSDAAIGERRRVTEAIKEERGGATDHAAMDQLYDGLNKRLEDARTALGDAIDRLATEESKVPEAGADPLASIPADIDRSAVTAERAGVTKHAGELRERETHLRFERARLLMAEVELLNRARLEMLPYLSSDKRSDITGFGSIGFRHARAEVLQVWLTIRYHLHVTSKFLKGLQSGDGRGSTAWAASLIALKWVVPIAIFIWWRRRAAELLKKWRTALRDAAKKRRRRQRRPDVLVRVLSFIIRIRNPSEWLLLLWSVLWLLPNSIRSLLEVELIATIFSWTLGGSLVVNVIHALSSDDVRGPRRAVSKTQTAHLRLKSLQVLGRAVVTVGLILSLSDKLVGQGTIYDWVLSTCWLAAIPILMFIVSWWRPVIFERIELARKKSTIEKWVLSKQKGAMSFIAAVVGGAYLFGVGALRIVRGWVVTFNITRRLLAYLFRRDMTKQAKAGKKQADDPIEQTIFNALGPENESVKIVPSVADQDLARVRERIKAPGGGIFAIVGERGGGKTTLMKRMADASPQVVMLECPTGGVDAFKCALNVALELDEDAEFEHTEVALDKLGDRAGVLVDDCHHLILPMMEGLRGFDRVLGLARRSSLEITWVFAIDQVLWRFLERARGSRPLFDDVIHVAPWSEEGIVRLLTQRSDAVDIDPVFDALVGELPDDADEVDRAEARQRTEENYYRLLWDYAAGNPGVALHFWRRSLGMGADGKTHVRLFTAPDADELQGLPDSTVFVLRAIVQLGWGTFEQICDATSLPPAQVKDALRFGTVQGYFKQNDDRYQITWGWFRAITRYLQRRHLLFST